MQKYYHAPSNIDIINAAQSRDVGRIKSIRLTDESIVTRSDERGYTAFHWAAYSDDVEVFDALNEDSYKYVWECLTLKGMTCLHVACANNSIRIVRRIVEIFQSHPADKKHIDDQNVYKETALHLAAAANNTEIVQILLDCGVNTLLLDQWSRTARRVALENGYTAMAEQLPAHEYDELASDLPVNAPRDNLHGVPPFATEQTVLDQEFLNQELKAKLAIMQLREEDGCGVDSLGLKPVETHVSSMFGGSPSNTHHKTALSAEELNNAVEFASRVEVEVIPSLSSRSADGTTVPCVSEVKIRSRSNTSSSPPTIHSHRPSSPGTSPTHADKIALSKLVEFPGDPSKLQTQLQDRKIALNGKDMYGLTALMKFAAWDKVDLLQLLLPHLNTNEINVTGGKQKLPLLHYCIDMGASRTLTVLLGDKRVDQNQRDEHGRTFQEHAHHVGKGEWLAEVVNKCS